MIEGGGLVGIRIEEREAQLSRLTVFKKMSYMEVLLDDKAGPFINILFSKKSSFNLS